jgi:large subunit ribosomal protein L13
MKLQGMKTYSAKPADVTRAWYILDASKTPLGRLSTQAAKLLMGKDKTMYTKNIDCGDFVIIINAAQLVVTGKKLDQKMYYRHSGYPGALKEVSLADQIEKDPTKVIAHSVRGMLPVNKLRNDRLIRLKIYSDDQHKHEAQKPVEFSIGETK